MINWLDFAAYAVLLSLVILLLAYVIRLRLKARSYLATSAQLAVDKITLFEQLAKMVEERDTKSVEETEGFVRFLSDSREWAFDYIDDIQQALTAYDVALSTDNASIINDAYKKLISFLPEDDVVS